MFIHSIHRWPSRGCLTHLAVSLAVAPVANVGHGLRAALEHTKPGPHAVYHFSFVGAAIRPRVHAMVHGDVLHKVSLGKTAVGVTERRQWHDPQACGLWETRP